MNFIKKYFAKIDANHQFKLGVEELKKGLIDNAIELFDRAIEKYEDHLPSHSIKGEIYLDMQRWDKAIECFRKVENLNDSKDNISLYIGVAECGVGNTETGIKYLNKQIEKTPLRPEPYWNKAIANLRVEKFDKALIDIDKALNILPHNGYLYSIKAEILDGMNDYENAEKNYDIAISKDENYINGKIEFQIRNDKINDAIKELKILIEKHPFEGGLYFKRGELYEKLNNNELALNDYKKAFENGITAGKIKMRELNIA